MMGNLNDDEIQEIYSQRNKFFKATEDLREDIYSKQLELRSELAKKNPDAKKTVNLQGDISKLQAQLDQKRIDHMVEMRKINPNAGRGFMGYGGMRHGGMGYGGMGYGSGPGGYCWR